MTTIHNLPKAYFSRLLRGVLEFDLIEEGDRILIGLSGGKDSLFLAFAMAALQKVSAKPFELAALTLDAGFAPDFPQETLAAFCAKLDIPFHFIQADIASIIQENQGKDPCFTCAFFRRGAINRFAAEHGFQKVAYAHHHDDAVETLLMNLLHSGQIGTFLPKTALDRSGVTVIRPLLFFREAELRDAWMLHVQEPIPNPCPFNGKTQRQATKELIASLASQNPAIYDHLAAAMREDSVHELWPKEATRAELKEKNLLFWKKPVKNTKYNLNRE